MLNESYGVVTLCPEIGSFGVVWVAAFMEGSKGDSVPEISGAVGGTTWGLFFGGGLKTTSSFGKLQKWGVEYGHESKHRLSPSEHPNPTTRIGFKMGGEFTYPRMVFHWF